MDTKGIKGGVVIPRTIQAEQAQPSAQTEATSQVHDPAFNQFADHGIVDGSGGDGSSRSIGARLMGAARSIAGAFARTVDRKTASQQGDQAVDDLRKENREMKLDLVELNGMKRTLQRDIDASKGKIADWNKKLSGAKADFTSLTEKGDAAGAAAAKESGVGYAKAVVEEQGRLDRLNERMVGIDAAIGRATTATSVHERQTDKIADAVGDAQLDQKIGRMENKAGAAVDGLDGKKLNADEAIRNMHEEADRGHARLDGALATGVGRDIQYEIKADDKAAEDLFNKA